MLNIIGGMDQLTTGTFLFDGKDYSKADEKTLTEYRRHSVGCIFQAYNLIALRKIKHLNLTNVSGN